MKKPKSVKRFIIKISGIFIGLCLLTTLLLLYGPYKGFSDFWITTAMHTSEHKYLAKMFYSEKYIQSVLQRNRVIPTEEITDSGQISGEVSDDITVTAIKGNSYKGYLLKVSDPKRVSVAACRDEKGSLLEDIVKEYRAVAGVNASGYKSVRQPGIASKFSVIEYQMISSCNTEFHQTVGFDENHTLIVGKFTTGELTKRNFKYAIEFGPILIVNGKKSTVLGNGGGLSPRTAIGQTSSGAILLLVIDGRQISSIGATLLDVQNILYENGAVNALNLDGGASTSMVYQDKLINSPSQADSHRLIPNAIIIK